MWLAWSIGGWSEICYITIFGDKYIEAKKNVVVPAASANHLSPILVIDILRVCWATTDKDTEVPLMQSILVVVVQIMDLSLYVGGFDVS